MPLRHGGAAARFRLLCLLLLGFAAAAAAQPLPPQPTTRLTAGIHLITAEVVQDYATRARGLMFRDKLAPNGGMLFVFEDSSVQCMWMRNTVIPLSVAFIDDHGAIVNVEEMKALDEVSQHCSKKPVRYALEMSEGWFSKHGLKSGSKIGGLPR